MPGVAARVEQPQQESTHEGPQSFCRRRVRPHAKVERILLERAALIVGQHLPVERVLVAEVIVDRRDVRARPPADFPHRGVVEPRLGKDRAAGFNERLAGLRGGGVELGLGGSGHFKRTIQTPV